MKKSILFIAAMALMSCQKEEPIEKVICYNCTETTRKKVEVSNNIPTYPREHEIYYTACGDYYTSINNTSTSYSEYVFINNSHMRVNVTTTITCK